MGADVSIIIPVYNYERYIGECLKSCVSQAYKDIEVIAVDDASSDGSIQEICRWAGQDDRIKFLQHKENMGYSSAKNSGIKYATGKFIIHLDADDMLTPDGVIERYWVMAKHPEYDMVHGYALRVYGGSTYEQCIENQKHLSKRMAKGTIHAQGVMIKRAVYEKYGLYYEGLRSKADKEMWYRLGVHHESPLPKLIKAKQIDADVAYYRKHDQQMHKLRRDNKVVNDEIERSFNERIDTIKRDGITTENTLFL